MSPLIDGFDCDIGKPFHLDNSFALGNKKMHEPKYYILSRSEILKWLFENSKTF
jgi:hypothetical protein